jgi:general secretion pathway protein M
MLESLQQNPTLLNLRKQYEMLPQRDRLALKILSLVLGIVILYFAMWQPAYQYKQNAELNLERNQALLALINDNSAVLSSGSRSGGKPARKILDSQQLVSSVTNLAKQKGIVLKRFEPSGESKLKVWVDDVSFDKMMVWLSTMRKSLSVTVEQISIDKDDDPGKVSARLTLSS